MINKRMLSKVIYLGNFQPIDDMNNEGICHICLRKMPLTKEHIPPKSAFNNCPQLWDYFILSDKGGGVKNKKLQNGLWVKTICQTCNNEVCSIYAKEYVYFVKDLVSSSKLFDSYGEAILTKIEYDSLYLAKEIATMILAIEPLTFAKHNEELRRFVLNKDLVINPRFNILAFLVPNTKKAGNIARFHGRVDTYAPGYGFSGGEISWYPFGFVYASEIGSGYYCYCYHIMSSNRRYKMSRT